jgi:hypothetical protein
MGSLPTGEADTFYGEAYPWVEQGVAAGRHLVDLVYATIMVG